MFVCRLEGVRRFAGALLGLSVAALSGTLAGCSSNSASPEAASVSGTFAGQALDVADTAAFQGSSTTGSYLGIVVSSTGGVCMVTKQGALSASTSRLTLVIEEAGTAAVPSLAIGTYSITGGSPAAAIQNNEPYANSGGADSSDPADPLGGTTSPTEEDAGSSPPALLAVTASFDSYDATCSPTLAATATGATSGSITLTTLTSSSIVGSFDLHFASGDHLSGRFASPVCSGADLDLGAMGSAQVASGAGGASGTPLVANQGASSKASCVR